MQKNDVANKTERRLQLDRYLGLRLRRNLPLTLSLTVTVRRSAEIEEAGCGLLCHLAACVPFIVWCECYGNLLSSAYTKLETRKALGNLHESCPQTALPAGKRDGEFRGICEVTFFDFHTQTTEQRHTKGFFLVAGTCDSFIGFPYTPKAI